ncbi:hypothetical protein [uncultured Bacteroides sp.]|uniref:hypothetical protein n=1 Tax=uncultured Bacteroides sp. TaxID=162156 RepID=UPI002AA6D55B|nr:hypothetical protein [uncultured Bacteroides sp.]
MKDLLQFLLIVGIIGVAIIRQISKNKPEKADATPRTPSPKGEDDESPSLPGGWEQWFPTEQKSAMPPVAHEVIAPAATTVQQRKKELSKKNAPLPPTKKNNQKQDSPPQTNNNEQDFGIHSAEDARRAIIWSEILQRKY